MGQIVHDQEGEDSDYGTFDNGHINRVVVTPQRAGKDVLRRRQLTSHVARRFQVGVECQDVMQVRPLYGANFHRFHGSSSGMRQRIRRFCRRPWPMGI